MIFRLPTSVLTVFALTVFTLVLATFIHFLGDTYKPLHSLKQKSVPFFTDDMDIASLVESAKHQAAFLKRQPLDKKINLGTSSYTNRWLLLSVEDLLDKLKERPDAAELNHFLHKNYLVYQAGGRRNKSGRHMLVTGYYEPLFEGSLTREAPYLTPLYTPPPSLIVVPAASNREKRIGRYGDNNNIVNFWSRSEIETQNLLHGYELAYLKDPVDAFLLHVQGSGRIQLPDGTVRAVRFAGSNGLEYKSIGKLLVDEKIMSLEEVTIPAIRAYLLEHPKQQQRILHHNPRFIFFTWGDSLGPRGSSGEVLTPGRSIAIDASVLPGGTIGYLTSRRPMFDRDGKIKGWSPINRLVFPQDSGAAIKGTGRVDIFWGSGNYAELAANHMKEDGKLYFLVKKGYPGP